MRKHIPARKRLVLLSVLLALGFGAQTVWADDATVTSTASSTEVVSDAATNTQSALSDKVAHQLDTATKSTASTKSSALPTGASQSKVVASTNSGTTTVTQSAIKSTANVATAKETTPAASTTTETSNPGVTDGTKPADSTKEQTPVSPTTEPAKPVAPAINYSSSVAKSGWQADVANGKTSGTVGKSKYLKAIKVSLTGSVKGNVLYKTQMQTYGWQKEVSNGAVSGYPDKEKRIEALAIRLTGDIAKQYDLYYRANVQTLGWLAWARNGQLAGTEGAYKRLEAYQVKLVKKGTKFNVGSGKAYYKLVRPTLTYRGHSQTVGWQETVREGKLAGTEKKAKRLEGIKIYLKGNDAKLGSIQYRMYLTGLGWQKHMKDGELAGTEKKAKRTEAIQIKLTGVLSERYTIAYRAHVQISGWQNWVYDGAQAGKIGRRLEGIEIRLLAKGKKVTTAPKSFIDVSSHNGYISVAEYKTLLKKGVTGVVVKLTEGTYYVNSFAREQILNAKKAGLKVSVYHFARYSTKSEAIREAKFFAAIAKDKTYGLSKSTLMINDIEASETLTKTINANMQAWETEMKKQGFNNLIHYTMASMMDINGYGGWINVSQFGNKNFWVAHYKDPKRINTAQAAKKESLYKIHAAWQFSSTVQLLPSHIPLNGIFDLSIDYTGRFTK